MAGTVSAGLALYDALSALEGTVRPNLDPVIPRGQAVKDVILAIIEAVHPIDGTLDCEAQRRSSQEAMSELLKEHPAADLFNLTEEQKFTVLARFVAHNIYQQVDLDIGKAIRAKAPSVASAMTRLNEVRNYIKQVVAASFRILKSSHTPITRTSLQRLISSAIQRTLLVFEEFLK